MCRDVARNKNQIANMLVDALLAEFILDAAAMVS